MPDYRFTEEESKENAVKDADTFLTAFTTHVRESIESDRRQRLDWHDRRNPPVEDFKEDVNRAVRVGVRGGCSKAGQTRPGGHQDRVGQPCT